MPTDIQLTPLLVPLGDTALLIRFGNTLSEPANRAAIAFAHRLEAAPPHGVVEIAPNLVSVRLRYDPLQIEFQRLCGELRLLLSADASPFETARLHTLPISYNGEDLDEIITTLGLDAKAFIAAHGARPVRVLATGFAPGFVYCGFHPDALIVSRRKAVRPMVPAGTVLFAAGQTAIAATPVPTGWHVIGHTTFRNFDAAATPPTRLAPGDELKFEVAR